MQRRNANHARGIDVSHWQGQIDWVAVKKSGIRFAFAKATEGQLFVDDMFASHIEGAKSQGILVGAYHFSKASDPEESREEADFFLENVKGKQLELPHVLDIETKKGRTKDKIVAICRAWLERVKSETGVQPMIYTYPSFIDSYLDASLSHIPLWYACYNDRHLEERGGWERWEFLQYTNIGSVPGIKGNVDLNEYAGAAEHLTAKYGAGNSASNG